MLYLYNMQKYNILELTEKELPELQIIAKDLGLKRVKSLEKQDLIYKILDEQAVSLAGIQMEKEKEREARKSEQKAKRGRKPSTGTKKTTAEDAAKENGEPAEEKPRRRGRPPKKQTEKATSETETNSTVKKRRKPGRPPKNAPKEPAKEEKQEQKEKTVEKQPEKVEVSSQEPLTEPKKTETVNVETVISEPEMKKTPKPQKEAPKRLIFKHANDTQSVLDQVLPMQQTPPQRERKPAMLLRDRFVRLRKAKNIFRW